MADENLKGLWRVEGTAAETDAVVKTLGLRLAGTSETADWSLHREDGLWRLGDREGRRLRIDFDAAGPDYRRRAPKGKGEILARALGKGTRTILDLSAGLGQDAVFLAQLGFEVTAVERHPVLALLLAEARAKTARPELRTLSFVASDALEFLRNPDRGADRFDAAYFDPMYPSKKKSALPRQEMVLFRGLVGADADAADVALAAARKVSRLVIKRPDEAPPLIPKPTASFEGSTVRYDVYVR